MRSYDNMTANVTLSKMTMGHSMNYHVVGRLMCAFLGKGAEKCQEHG